MARNDNPPKVEHPWRKPNRKCACGCGQEVRLPENKYVLGHSGPRKGSRDWQRYAVRMWKLGWKYQEIADHFGLSKSRVNQVISDEIWMENRPPWILEMHKRNEKERAKKSVIQHRPNKEEEDGN